MRNLTPPLMAFALKLLPVAILASVAMPAHSVFIDTPAVKDGLRLQFYTSVYPRISTTSNKFSYTYGQQYGSLTSLESVLANQDRKDSDERYRLAGLSSMNTQFYGYQQLNKDWQAYGVVYLQYSPTGSNNWGAPWGITLTNNYENSIGIGTTYSGLGVQKTNADNLFVTSGTAIQVESTKIPDLTLTGYYMFNQTGDARDRTDFGWHKSVGASAAYDFNFAPRNVLTVAGGVTHANGHDSPWYTNQAGRNHAYMGGVSYQYQNLTLSADYGERTEQFNGIWFDNLKSKSYGVKADYQFTPRLKGSLSYSYFEADNDKPVAFQDIVNRNIGINEERYFFDKTKKDRYNAELSYNVWRGIDVIGSVESAKSKNYVAEGEFSKRDTVTATAGARFTF